MSQIIKKTIIPIDSTLFFTNLRAIIKDNENGKVAMRELQVTRNSLDTAKMALNLKDSALSVIKQKDTARQQQLYSYSQAIDLLKEQNIVSQKQVAIVNQQRLKEKRAKIVFQVTTIIGILASGYFAIIR